MVTWLSIAIPSLLFKKGPQTSLCIYHAMALIIPFSCTTICFPTYCGALSKLCKRNVAHQKWQKIQKACIVEHTIDDPTTTVRLLTL